MRFAGEGGEDEDGDDDDIDDADERLGEALGGDGYGEEDEDD